MINFAIFIKLTEEKFGKEYNVCKIIDPIMIIQACITNQTQNDDLDANSKLCFEKMNRAVKKIYEYILEDKKAK